MKANMSMDGERRIDVRVEYRLDKLTVVRALGSNTARYEDTSDLDGTTLSEKEIMRRVRRQLMFGGLDDLDFLSVEDTGEEVMEWALGQVNKYWKEV